MDKKVDEEAEMPVLAMDPARQALREYALRNTRNMAKKVRARALKHCPGRGLHAVGTVVQLGIDRVDRGKFDSHTLLGVIVCVTPSTLDLVSEWYTIALRHCVLRDIDKLADYDLAAVSLTPLQAGLEHCLKTWQEMPVQGPRAAARSESHMGGQGVVRCNCHGVCSRRCKCKREGRVCTAACRCDPNLCQNCSSFTHTRGGVVAKSATKQQRSRGSSRRVDKDEPADEVDDTPQYGVERLLNHRLKKGCKNNLEFLVRWEGYGPESDSWEPRVNIEGSLIQEYSTG